MPVNKQLYDPDLEMWPDLERGRMLLAPVRVGMDRRTGRVLVGWPHVYQSIQMIIATRFHERVLRRWVGSLVPHLLGQSAIQRVITRFYWAIASAIDLHEPNYDIQRIRIDRRGRTSGDEDLLTSPEELRRGKMDMRAEGVYRPRAHLGDDMPETRQVLGLVSSNGMWGAS